MHQIPRTVTTDWSQQFGDRSLVQVLKLLERKPHAHAQIVWVLKILTSSAITIWSALITYERKGKKWKLPSTPLCRQGRKHVVVEVLKFSAVDPCHKIFENLSFFLIGYWDLIMMILQFSPKGNWWLVFPSGKVFGKEHGKSWYMHGWQMEFKLLRWHISLDFVWGAGLLEFNVRILVRNLER